MRLLDAGSVARIVNQVGLRRFLLLLVEYLKQDFERWESFDKSPRCAAHSSDGVIELMPTSDGETYCFKYVSGHPKNTLAHLQTVVAFGVLADVATGYPLLLADMTLATAFRTAAISALAAQYLARPDSRTMALIGAGAQSEFQARAFQTTLGVKRLRVFDVDPAAVKKFERNMEGSGVSIVRCANAQDAAIGADIITTITAEKKFAMILSDGMVRAGVHINAIGGDCPGKTEIAKDVLMRSEIFVEYEPQTRVEGEIQQLDANYPVTELWQIITGRKAGRTSESAITIFDSVGFAIEDFSVLRLLRDLADEIGVNENLDLIAEPEDPKNLFALISSPKLDRNRKCA